MTRPRATGVRRRARRPSRRQGARSTRRRPRPDRPDRPDRPGDRPRRAPGPDRPPSPGPRRGTGFGPGAGPQHRRPAGPADAARSERPAGWDGAPAGPRPPSDGRGRPGRPAGPRPHGPGHGPTTERPAGRGPARDPTAQVLAGRSRMARADRSPAGLGPAFETERRSARSRATGPDPPARRPPSGRRPPAGPPASAARRPPAGPGGPRPDRPWERRESDEQRLHRSYPAAEAAGLVAPGEELVAGRHPVEEALTARRPARRLLVVPQRRDALERIVLHATTPADPDRGGRGRDAHGAGRLRRPPGRRGGARGATVRIARGRPRAGDRAGRAAVRPRARLPRGSAEPGQPPAQRRGGRRRTASSSRSGGRRR